MGQAQALVDRFWEAFETHDFDTLASLIAPAGECVMPGDVHARGPEEIVPLLQAYAAALPDLRHEVISIIEAGDAIALEIRTTGTFTGALLTPAGAVPPTGKRLDLVSCDYIRTAEGKIRSWHAYYDQLAFLGQLGLLPAPVSA